MLNTSTPKRLIYIDFEYNQTNEQKLNLICAAVLLQNSVTKRFWLHDKSDTKALKDLLLSIRSDTAICCFNATAEAHAIFSLGLNELKFFWVDLQCEWRMMCNANNKFSYGKQLIKGKKKTTYPLMKYQDSDGLDHSKAESNLAACTYKLLGVEIDTKEKGEVRKIILSNRGIEENKEKILAYCESDIFYLPRLWKEIKTYWATKLKISKDQALKEILYRGESVARTSRMMALGYPVDIVACESFYNNVPSMLLELENEINGLFPNIMPFEFNKKTGKNVKKYKSIATWIKQTPFVSAWQKTEKGELSIALEAFEKHYHYRHQYPKDCFGAQMLRYLRFRQSLSGFVPTALGRESETFFDFVGSDGRSRVWLNPYGAKTSRFQPKAKGFLFLKAAWMRALCVPEKGSVICGIDFSQQEFLISALLSNDINMIDAYRSGDVYLYFAKLAKAVPMDGTKDQYKKERDLFKATTLGLSYGMAAKALAYKLEQDTGVKHTQDQAQSLIDKFYKAFPTYAKWREKILIGYQTKMHLRLIDGWYLFGDNDNDRSTQNFPVQGMGAAILRRAIKLCQERGLNVIFPLHDALYVEFSFEKRKEKVQLFYDSMREAFISCFDSSVHADLIKVDVNMWGPNLDNGIEQTETGIVYKTQNKYIDPRAAEEYEKFSKYFNT